MNNRPSPDDGQETEPPTAGNHLPVNGPDISLPPAIYPVMSIGGGYFLQRFIPLLEPSHGSFTIAGPITFVISIAILGWSLTTLRKFKTATMPHRPATHLVTTGPYRFSRNPMYLAFILLTLASALATGNIWILLSLPGVMWALAHYAIHPEEAHLQKAFGDRYNEYSRKVRRWL